MGKLNAIQVAETTRETTENFAVNLGTIQSFLDNHAVPYVSNDSTQSKNYADIAAAAMRYTNVEPGGMSMPRLRAVLATV